MPIEKKVQQSPDKQLTTDKLPGHSRAQTLGSQDLLGHSRTAVYSLELCACGFSGVVPVWKVTVSELSLYSGERPLSSHGLALELQKAVSGAVRKRGS